MKIQGRTKTTYKITLNQEELNDLVQLLGQQPSTNGTAKELYDNLKWAVH